MAGAKQLVALAWALVLPLICGQAPSAAVPPLPSLVLASKPVDEVAVLHKLRQVLRPTDIGGLTELGGWNPDDIAHPCAWGGVTCDANKRIVHLKLILGKNRMAQPSDAASGGGSDAGSDASPASESLATAATVLLPDLASLPHLQGLQLLLDMDTLQCGIPAEWGKPGAFPNLTELVIRGTCLPAPLPDMLPGALPRLRHLTLELPLLQATLPASWGSSPATLPSLEHLELQLNVLGHMPPAWARGFCKLQTLAIKGLSLDAVSNDSNWSAASPHVKRVERDNPTIRCKAAAPSAAPVAQQQAQRQTTAGQLPSEWADGFGQLQKLELKLLNLAGSFPEAWTRMGAFPRLQVINMDRNCLTGRLPGQLLGSHPGLLKLLLPANLLSGSLPEKWGQFRALEMLDLECNELTGPAFPATWLKPGGMPSLNFLLLAENPGISGTLPANLAWPSLRELSLYDTGVTGAIPDTWCQSPAASRLQHVFLGPGKQAAPLVLPPCTAEFMPHLWEEQLPPGPNFWAGPAVIQSLDQHHSSRQDPWPLAAAASLAALSLLCIFLAGLAAAAGLNKGTAVEALRCIGLLRANGSAPKLAEGDSLLPGSQPTARHCKAVALENVSARKEKLLQLLHSQLGERRWDGILSTLPIQPLLGPLTHMVRDDSTSSVAPAASTTSDSGYSSEAIEAGSGWQSSDLSRSSTDYDSASSFQHLPRKQEQQEHSGNAEKRGGSTGGAQWAAAVDSSQLRALLIRSLQLPVQELEFVLDASGRLVELGQGGHAVVYLGRLQGVSVAVKVLELPEGQDTATVWHELCFTHYCGHHRVVPLYGVAIRNPLVYLVMQWMPRGSLHDAMANKEERRRLRWHEGGGQVAADVAEALVHLHGMGVLHSDLKPSNVLLSAEYRAVLADLGAAQLLLGRSRSAIGLTRHYAAPEQVVGQHVTLAADMYAFGILLSELATLEVGLGLKRGDWRLPHAPHECPQGVADLICDCLSLEPSCRPTAMQALQRLRANVGL